MKCIHGVFFNKYCRQCDLGDDNDEVSSSGSNALLAASKQEWLEEAKKMIDGMTADEFESFIIGCSVEDTEKAFYEASKKMGW